MVVDNDTIDVEETALEDWLSMADTLSLVEFVPRSSYVEVV
jgi:hypothetical protein